MLFGSISYVLYANTLHMLRVERVWAHFCGTCCCFRRTSRELHDSTAKAWSCLS